MTIGSLFSGIGGLELGLERAGLGPVLWQCEMDPYCRRVLARHWPEATRFEDVRDVGNANAARVDVVCGGFPCQPVSLAGARLAQQDPRWLWPEFARVVRELRPAHVVAENVLGLRSAGLRDVLADLAALGFDAEWSSLAAEEVGAPHRRRRIFIVATHSDRAELREQPGWLSRACGAARASVVANARSGWGAVADSAAEGWDAGTDGTWVHGQGWPGELDERPGDHPQTVGVGSSDANGLREPQPQGGFGEVRGWACDSGWRHAPPPVRGVDDGATAGLDACAPDAVRVLSEAADDEVEAPDSWRIAALGNAVVPQVAEVIGRALRNAEAA